MNVHEAISKHSRKQHEHLETFQQLDSERERLIQEAVERILKGEPFATEAINRVTSRINEHAKSGISPLRQYVTEEMVLDYVSRLKEAQSIE